MRVFLTIAMLALMSTATQAAIIFSTVASKTDIALGDTATFNIFVRSDAGSATIAGIDAIATAGLGDGSAGTFIAGPTFGLGNIAFDLNSGGPGIAASSQFSSTNQLTLDSTNVLYGSLTLSTAGATAGNYQFTLDNTFATIASGAAFTGGTVDAAPVSYSISAVPEPSSIALLGIIGGAAGARRWYKKRKDRLAKTNCA